MSTEVVPRPKRCFKSNAEKRRIVAEANAWPLFQAREVLHGVEESYKAE